jgi:hypothetical protein
MSNIAGAAEGLALTWQWCMTISDFIGLKPCFDCAQLRR